jgi:two-component system phosphate regulon sensor histidine kinase PhoR
MKQSALKSPQGRLIARLSIAAIILFWLVAFAALWLVLKAEYTEALTVFTGGVAVLVLASLFISRLSVKEQQSLEERLAARDARYRQTLELLPEAVVIVLEGRIDWVNSASKRYFGITLKNAGESLENLIDDEDFRAWLKRRSFLTHYTLKKDGPDAFILDVAVVAPDDRHMIIVGHDMTERRRLDDMRRDFVANVSHELRTPLTVIAGFLDMADKEVSPEMRAYHLRLMKEQTARMQRLTDDLLALSRLERKDEIASEGQEAEVIDMPALIEDSVKEAKALSAGRHGFQVQAEPLFLIGYKDEIRSALANLLSNAVSYTPPGGRIRVTWRREGDGADLSVEDTGIGIAPEHIPRLTERFYRVDKGRSRATGGTGLGLAIVKHVLARNSGELRVRSRLGEGSTFTCHFSRNAVVDKPFA